MRLASFTAAERDLASGITAAHIDVGIIRLADGRHACIVSFISASTEDAATMNRAHAELAEKTYRALTDK